MKCELYLDLMIYSYSIGFALAIELLIHLMCIIWTAKCTPRFLRWAATWFPVCIVLQVAAMTTWFVITETTFEELDTKSYYPSPPPGASCIFSSIAGFGVLINCFLGCMLHRMWPEVEEDSEDEEEEDSEDDEGEAKHLKASKKAQQAQQGPPPGGMDPNMQGMDPNMQWQQDQQWQQGQWQDPNAGMQPMPAGGDQWEQPMAQQQQWQQPGGQAMPDLKESSGG